MAQSIEGSGRAMGKQPSLNSKLRLTALFATAFVVRFSLLYHTNLSLQLQDRPELSTPINSWKALLEAHHLFRQPPDTRIVDLRSGLAEGPYAAGTIHHSPLLLPLLDYPLSRLVTQNDKLAVSIIWSTVDIFAGWLLYRICSLRDQSQTTGQLHPGKWQQSRAIKVAALFLFNPYTMASCVAKSTVPLETAATLTSIYAVMTASVLPAAFAWALSSLLSFYPALLLPLLIQISAKRAEERVYLDEVLRIKRDEHTHDVSKKQKQRGFLVDRVQFAKRWVFLKSIILYPAALFGGLWLSRAVVLCPKDTNGHPQLSQILRVSQPHLRQGWEWTEQVYGTILLLTDLTPNLGLWWYFFMEMFDHFRDFFLLTFNVHVASYVLPFTIKYRQDPLFGLTVMCGVIAVFKSYPTMGDHALFLGLLSIHNQIFEYMRYPLISAMIYAYCSFLSPAFHHLWLTAGSANSNFFYAITLVWALGGGMLVLDSMWAWGRERWEKERPPIRPRSASQLTVLSSKNTEAIAERVEVQPQEPRKRVVIQV